MLDDPFGGADRFSVYDVCFKSEDILDKVHDLDKSPLEESRDVFMCEESLSLGIYNPLFLALSITLTRPLKILWFFILIMIWTMRITCLVCLVGILIILYP